MKKVVVISGTDHYEERMRSVIVEYQKEAEVIYLISDFHHVTKQHYTSELPFAKQLHVPAYQKNISVNRIWSHMVFSLKTFFWLCKEKPDTVYVEIPHNTLAIATSWYKSLHKCELIMDIFDMWPEALPIKSDNLVFRIVCGIWRSFRNWNLRHADKVYTECNYYQKLIKEEGCQVPMETKYLTREKVDLDIQTQWKEDVFPVAYVGNISNIIDISAITEFLSGINQKRRVCLHLIGNGESRAKLIESLEAENIRVISYGVVYDVYRLQEILNQCYFGINFLLPNLAIGLTMKSITYLRAGLPLLNTVDGDTWNMVKEYGAGRNIPREDFELVRDELLVLREADVKKMKREARLIFEKYFAEEN